MKKLLLGIIPVLILTVFTVTITEAASIPSDVTMSVHMIPHPGSDLGTGTFEASGPAVDAGLLCRTGTIVDLERHLGAEPSQQITTFFVHKLFTCEDGSGTFSMRLNGSLTANRCTARWLVTGGESGYASLLGEGGFSCAFLDDGTVQDTYFGQLHLR